MNALHSKIGDESRSYLGEHIFKQVFSIYATEEDKRERSGKRDREAFNKLGEKVKGSQLQVDQQRDGGTGSHSLTEQLDMVRGAEDGHRSAIRKTKAGVRPTTIAGFSCDSAQDTSGH